jgi:hypothetical protein
MSARAQRYDGRLLGELIGMAERGNDYCPTFARPEDKGMADAYDAACVSLGLPNRAWRGIRRTA